MLTGELRSKIDNVWNAFWAGGIANPLEVIEQITYLLFIRRVPDVRARNGLLVEEGDILFNVTNSPQLVGKTALFKGFSEPVTFSNHFLRIRSNRKVVEPAT